MLTHDDAMLILDHAAIVRESSGVTRYFEDGEEIEYTLSAEISGRILQCSRIEAEAYAGDLRAPYQCWDDCDCDEFEAEEEPDPFHGLRRELAAALVDDAASSNHRALPYLALRDQVREVLRRMNEIPQHLTEKDLAA